MGLGELLLRAATNIFSVLAIVLVIWLTQMYFRQPAARAQANGGHTPRCHVACRSRRLPGLPDTSDPSSVGILRQADLHTNVPERARQEIVTYNVQKGDTVSGIADRYGLQPKTIFAANYDILQDDPHSLLPDQKLRILPVTASIGNGSAASPSGNGPPTSRSSRKISSTIPPTILIPSRR